MEEQLLAILSLAFFLGLRHAADPDHVAAITTFVGRERSIIRSCWVGIFWGAGHTLSLAAAGVLVILLKVNISVQVEAGLEMAVALMLFVLGIHVLYTAWSRRFEVHRHAHNHVVPDTNPHVHWHVHSRANLESHNTWTHVGLRPLLVGMVHGAAGSGALMLLVLPTIRSSREALAYVLVFGVGSIAGMMLISCLMAMPLRWIGNRFGGAGYHHAQIVAGILSCLFGIYLASEI